MKNLALTTIVAIQLLGLLAWQMPAQAALAGSVVISEVQVAGATDSAAEFVELYNPTPDDVVLDGWMLQYHSSTASSAWATKATVDHGVIKSGGFFLFATGKLTGVAPDVVFAATLSNTAGSVRIMSINDADNPVDLVGWGAKSVAYETAPAPAPAPGKSLERLPGDRVADGGNGYDTDNNAADFILQSPPNPQTAAAAVELAADYTIPEPTPVEATDNYAALQITELFPDPAAPQTDAQDEFVELYNPNSFDVDAGGYVAEAGPSLGSKYILPAELIPAGTYLALYSADDHLALSNSGSQVALLDPMGTVVDGPVIYTAAEPGQAWAKFGNDWQWTITPTAAAVNVLTTQPTPTPKAAATPKPKAVAKPKTTTKTVSTKSASGGTVTTAVAAESGSSRWLLLGLASLTLGYIIYEFRYDLQNYYFRIRQHYGVGGPIGQTTSGRGGDRAGQRPGRWQDRLRTRLDPRSWLGR